MSSMTFLSVDQACADAVSAWRWLSATSPQQRAALLEAIADALDAATAELVPLAMSESHLPEARLTGEVGRTTGQLRLFASVIRDGACLEVVLDSARSDLTPPRPDLRRMLVGLGPVAVFTASNFPFAFSTLGGDTASALAAGCPVVVKAHPGHPKLTVRCAEIAHEALRACGAPVGVLSIVDDALETGVALAQDPRITAVAFTGSLRGGMALQKICNERESPIPFYGELGSINPVFVTAAHLAANLETVAAGFVSSYTLGAGQFCTKPGLLITTASAEFRAAIVSASAQVAPQPLLNDSISRGYSIVLTERTAATGVEVLHQGSVADGAATPTVLAVSAEHFLANASLLDECFGPMSIIVECDSDEQFLQIAQALHGSLTATITADGDEEVLAELVALLHERTGRLLWNGWPTGVAVTWSMTHGGPFPATTSPLHTSVGAPAIKRFLRPITFQNWPVHLLPPAVLDANPWQLARRVDGELQLSPRQ